MDIQNVIISLAVLMLMGCASSKVQFIRPIAPANLTTTCPPLPQPNSPSMGELLSYAVQTTQAYGECAAKHRALSQWLSEMNQ